MDLYLVPAVEIRPPTALLFREAAGGRVEAQQAAQGSRTLHTYGPQVGSSQMISSVVLYSGSILCSRCFPSTNSGVPVLTTPLFLFSALIPFSVLIPPSYSLSPFSSFQLPFPFPPLALPALLPSSFSLDSFLLYFLFLPSILVRDQVPLLRFRLRVPSSPSISCTNFFFFPCSPSTFLVACRSFIPPLLFYPFLFPTCIPSVCYIIFYRTLSSFLFLFCSSLRFTD